MNKVYTGTVIEYNQRTGIAKVELNDNSFAFMHTGAFISGRPNRHPQPEDKIKAEVIKIEDQQIITQARPIQRKI